MIWHRKLWAVEFTSKIGNRILLGDAWDYDNRANKSDNEPTRCLLFTTREAARLWCKKQRDKYTSNQVCKLWRFRPVRVMESVRKIK